MEYGNFVFLNLGATYDVHLRLIGKPICDLLILLLVNNNCATLHHFQVMADCEIFAGDRGLLHVDALAGGDPLQISR